MKIFEKELKEEEYQNIINYLKIHYKELRDEKDSNILSNKMPQNLILNKNKNINIKLPNWKSYIDKCFYHLLEFWNPY